DAVLLSERGGERGVLDARHAHRPGHRVRRHARADHRDPADGGGVARHHAPGRGVRDGDRGAGRLVRGARGTRGRPGAAGVRDPRPPAAVARPGTAVDIRGILGADRMRRRGADMPNIEFEQNGVQVSGYLSEPEDTAPKGGMVVIQEWLGLTPDIKEIADRYAVEGYLAFAPDIFHGQQTDEAAEARKLAMSMERDVTAREIDAAFAWLKQERGMPRVGCVGYCLGG